MTNNIHKHPSEMTHWVYSLKPGDKYLFVYKSGKAEVATIRTDINDTGYSIMEQASVEGCVFPCTPLYEAMYSNA
jgi:hypothetical protein